MKALLRDPKTTYNIPESEDIAKIKTRTLVSPVYLVQENGQTSKIIFPVYGKGLWSTMYGLLALGPDLNTVYGITYYEHGETPGLGGEIDNPKWQQGFVNKKLFKIESDGRLVPALTVIKGAVSSADGQADYKIDGLSGATMTSNGVTNSLTYWFGKNGFLPFVENFKANGGQI